MTSSDEASGDFLAQAKPEESPNAIDKQNDETPPGRASLLKWLWTKLDLDIGTLLMMFKGAIAPTIAVAIIQARDVATVYSTLGFLVAVIATLGLPIIPRAKFIQIMIFNILATCLAAATMSLALFTAVRARHPLPATQSPPPGTPPPQPYDSSAAAVCAVWFALNVYIVNALRAKFPQFVIPAIIYSIFVSITMSYGPHLPTWKSADILLRKTLESFLTGLAIATGVAFVVVPVSCRKVVFMTLAKYMAELRAMLGAHGEYFTAMETADVFKRCSKEVDQTRCKSPEAFRLKASAARLTSLHGKLHSDLPFAKREVAWGKISPEDFNEVSRLLRGVLIPITGLASVIDIFDRIASAYNNEGGWPDINHENADPDIIKRDATQDWNSIMSTVNHKFQSILEVMDEGVQHVMITFSLAKPQEETKKKKKMRTTNGDNRRREQRPNVEGQKDVERDAKNTSPGEEGFAAYMEEKCKTFDQGKECALRSWCQSKGIELSPQFFDDPTHEREFTMSNEARNRHRAYKFKNQRQLHLLLYMEYLLYRASLAILAMVKFADAKKSSGQLSRNRLITPGYRRIRKCIDRMFKTEDVALDQDRFMGDIDGGNNTLWLGEAYRPRKDPEHLPPTNAIERAGNMLRAMPRFLRSPESMFGLRVACATMSVAIIGYVRQTHHFFIHQRFVWAIIMVVISMSPTAGDSISGYALRLGGTAIAAVACYPIWYIPDGHTAGVIVVMAIFIAIGFYVLLKQPDLIVAGVVSIVTTILIIGYELEVRKIGRAVAESNGQPYYEIYLLAPYRLATVLGGLTVAFIWTIFPYPVSEHSALRERLGASLYLLANFYSIVHETLRARIKGHDIDVNKDSVEGKQLEKSRHSVFAKQVLLLDALRTSSRNLKWEIQVGGKFPKEQYDSIIQCVQNILNFSSLIGYASQTYTRSSDQADNEWFNGFQNMLVSARLTSHEVTSILSLLSASIVNGQPLPPYLNPPRPYQLYETLAALNNDILSIRHIAEPGYAAFAVVQISSRCIIADLDALLKMVRELVGELDFSFRSITVSDSNSSSNDALWKREDSREKKD
ncbi:hypothetical protein BDY21DRAFT_358551 [Lineolata rhizophorae]|uniref:ER transporter 6TM N-terminal domain-containing protein n=1 Tax=Lineolata rhizophorae TaxID=578093 RepID=A0A6A6NMX4_9PEZI|nr:hypothetical protein BDY21DRAFT_358551 [Lineolata rhizophorae]